MPLISAGLIAGGSALIKMGNENGWFQRRNTAPTNSTTPPPNFQPVAGFPITIGQSNATLVPPLQRKLMSLSPAYDDRLKRAGAVTNNIGAATASIIREIGFDLPLDQGSYNAIMNMGSSGSSGSPGKPGSPGAPGAAMGANKNLIFGGIAAAILAFLFLRKRK
jgi:hypothetical protein